MFMNHDNHDDGDFWAHGLEKEGKWASVLMRGPYSFSGERWACPINVESEGIYTIM